MLGRLIQQLPAIICLILISLTLSLTRKLQVKIDSGDWTPKYLYIIDWMISFLQTRIIIPAGEELIFRTPLIIFFQRVDGRAWLAIMAFGFLFGLAHYFKYELSCSFRALWKGDWESFGLGVKSILKPECVTEENEEIKINRIATWIITTAYGILIGYLAVKYHSLWLAFGIHVIFNIVVSPIISMIIILGLVVIYTIKSSAQHK